MGACKRLLLIAACLSGAAGATELPTLRLHGDELVSACATEKMVQLRNSVAAAKVADPAQVVRLLETLLCKPDSASNRAALRAMVAPELRQSVAATGDEDQVVMVTRDDDLLSALLAGGGAWNAHILASANKLVLQFQADEACVKSRTLGFVQRQWRVVAIGEACD